MNTVKPMSLRLDSEQDATIQAILAEHPAMTQAGIVKQCIDAHLPILAKKYLPAADQTSASKPERKRA